MNSDKGFFFNIEHRWKNEKTFSVGLNVGYRYWCGGEWSINLFLGFWAIFFGYNCDNPVEYK